MKKIFLLTIYSSLFFLLKGQSSGEIDSLITVSKIQKDTLKMNTLVRVSKLYNMKGMPDSAVYYYTLALADAKQVGTNLQICAIRLYLAEAQTRLAKYDEALEHLFSILKLSENGDCGPYGSKAKPAIGFIYIWQKKEKAALRYFLEAEPELQKWKDTSGLIAVYANLPVCLALNGDTVNAMTYFKKGFEIIDRYKLSNPSTSRKEYIIDKKLAYTYNMINFLVKKDDLNAVLNQMDKLQEEVKESTNPYQQFNLFCILADLHLRLKQYDRSQYYGELAAKLNTAEGNYSDLTDLYWVIATASAALKQYEKAYANMLLHNQYKDSVFQLSKVEAINSVEVKYQVEKKEQEIITLNKEKKAQRIIVGLSIGSLLIVLGLLAFVIRSKRLQKKLLNREKEIQKKELEQKMAELEQTALRAQMNPHFIFNCLNSVQRFIITNDAEGANHYLSTFANLIRQTLENSGKQLIPFKVELQYLETYIKMEQLRSNNNFDYSINIDPEIDQAETYIPNMIIQPYIENSIHHGMINTKDRKGQISLHVSKNSKLNFVVEDNGEGFKNMQALRQTRQQGHQSMGSTITEKRIEMYNKLHDEKIELEILDKSAGGSSETGTRVTLKFPLNN